MISKVNPVWANAVRGTIEVYSAVHGGEWYWRAKSKNGQILAQGEGYKRRASCLNALEVLFGSRITDEGSIVTPWRLVVGKRDGDIDWIGQIL